jgi:hypothetical protein
MLEGLPYSTEECKGKLSWLLDGERQQCLDFLEGAVYCWRASKNGERFSLRLLMGVINRNYWSGTPLQVLCDHESKFLPNKTAFEKIGQDSGWLLQEVLVENTSLHFVTEGKEEMEPRLYRCTDCDDKKKSS